MSSPGSRPRLARALEVGALILLCGLNGGAALAQAGPASPQERPPQASGPAQPSTPFTGSESDLREFQFEFSRPKATNNPSGIARTPAPTGQQTGASATPPDPGEVVLTAFEILLLIIVSMLVIYTIRHYVFTLNRLFGRQRHPFVDIDTAVWPQITVMIAAHNEEAVIADSIKALLDVDYPQDKLLLMPVNDRSTDRTREIVDALVAQHPGRIQPFHRSSGKPGKAAALKDATELAKGDILIVFDADYIPGQGLIKQLVAPFFDPEVGAVMGRVVPMNAGHSMLTRLLDLERAGGYQVDQQARMNLGLSPQYGGTVGGIRKSALIAVGGWHDDVLAEDTDLTFRLLLGGWQTVYTNRSECYEEVPEEWAVRIRQIKRWSRGHNQALSRHWRKVARSPSLVGYERLDAMLLLLIYAMSPILLLGWLLALVLYFLKPDMMLSGAVAVFALLAYNALGNFAAFFEIGAACYLDGSGKRLRLLPLNAGGFLVSMISISQATLSQMFLDRFKGANAFKWDKTIRYRRTS